VPRGAAEERRRPARHGASAVTSGVTAYAWRKRCRAVQRDSRDEERLVVDEIAVVVLGQRGGQRRRDDVEMAAELRQRTPLAIAEGRDVHDHATPRQRGRPCRAPASRCTRTRRRDRRSPRTRSGRSGSSPRARDARRTDSACPTRKEPGHSAGPSAARSPRLPRRAAARSRSRETSPRRGRLSGCRARGASRDEPPASSVSSSACAPTMTTGPAAGGVQMAGATHVSARTKTGHLDTMHATSVGGTNCDAPPARPHRSAA